jgi:ATP-dependent Lhr-like helicase
LLFEPGCGWAGYKAVFHPLVQKWFAETYGRPTAVQAEAWPLIAAGEHVLALAPTGSGKTLTAFLGAISRFIDGTYSAHSLSVLYVSPLKALNEDIRRNLLGPVASMGALFEREGAAFPDIRVETRSGDTPQSERRRFLAKPPAMLALTPESLAILLLNPRGRQVLSSVQYLILDEIHTALGTKRGAFLSCQIDRLSLVAGEFQRVALSATTLPPEAAAAFVGGLGPQGPRPVRIVAPLPDKKIEVLVDFPPPGEEEPGGEWKKADRYGPRYTALIHAVLDRLGIGSRSGSRDSGGAEGGSTLVFTDSRRRAERIAFLINRRAEELGAERQVAYTHHGSLAKELRRAVEQRLAEGRLPCVVATGSLELGIDIGSVDEVILAGTPGVAAAALQRLGRSGHGVGQTSRGRIIPFHGVDLLIAAALSSAIAEREIEETRAIENPLDILAQIILALCVEKKRHTEDLYQTLRGFYVFRDLPRPSYDAVIRMLTGHYASTRIRELKPRLFLDREAASGPGEVRGELAPMDGTLGLLYLSGGVIANRGYYSLRLPTGVKIGELDEEFVWERRLGDTFDFGARSWRITAIGSEAVEAVPLDTPSDYAPFWRAEAQFRSPVLVRRTLELFDRFNESGAVAAEGLSDSAREELLSFLSRQKNAQAGAPLPSLNRFPVEIVDDTAGRDDAYAVLLHSFRGAAVNYPLAMALAQELEERTGLRMEALPDDNTVLLFLPRQGLSPDKGAAAPESLIRQSLLALGERTGGRNGLPRWESLFRKRLEGSGIFGAAFREAAERSLLLPKASFGKRTPLWITRQRSKRLFDAVCLYDDFPVTAEAWRSCLQDQFDMQGCGALIAGIGDGTVEPLFFRSRSPSPFARDILWKETNIGMYQYDERPDLRGRGQSGKVSLADRIIQEALGKGAARPSLSKALVADFEARLRRELPLWTPHDALTLAEWVKERVAIPQDEWETLVAAAPAELREALASDPGLAGHISLIRREGAALSSVAHREWAETWRQEGIAQLGPWLRYQGPVSLQRLAAVFGVAPAEAEGAVDALEESGELVRDVTVGNEKGLVCDRENLELLLRLARKKARPAARERPAPLLIPYLAMRQGILPGAKTPGALPGGASPSPWKTLAGYGAPAPLWESDIFPARVPAYAPELLDREIAAGNLIWYGSGRERIGFCAPEDLDLIFPGDRPSPFGGDAGYFEEIRDFWAIKEWLGKDTLAAAEALWEEVWKGLLSADSFEPARRGAAEGFVPKALRLAAASPFDPAGLADPRTVPLPWGLRRVPRALRNRWKAGPPVPGSWFSLAPSLPEGGVDPEDSLDDEALNRDRVRILANRWGILARPLLEREEPALSWGRLLPSIRRLELAGELVAGRFFSGIDSLQFARPGIERELEAAEALSGTYWMNAADPASPAGLAVSGLDPRLPPRRAASRLCFRGPQLIALSARNGRKLEVFIPPEDSDTVEALGFLAAGQSRGGKKILVETINGVSASQSDYAGALKTLGFLPDRSSLTLWQTPAP